MNNYELIRTQPLKLNCSVPLAGMFKLSPYVWREGKVFKMLIRAVNTSEDPTQQVARIFYGESEDGINFKMDDGPVIAPGTSDLSKDGVEDPTVVYADGDYLVYYTGWNLTKQRGELLLSKGKDIRKLNYAAEALVSHKDFRNPKEATVAKFKNGRWALFFEFANLGRSRIGLATSAKAEGPWNIDKEYILARPSNWDSYHLSTGPIVEHSDQMVMFYNGSDANAKWCIGWLTMDKKGDLLQRCTDPLITAPADSSSPVSIAFAASAILADEEHIWLYYSCEDKEPLMSLIKINQV